MDIDTNSPEGPDTTSPYPSILCGIEGGLTSSEAVRQAIALAAQGAALRFISVYTTFRFSKYTEEELRENLDEAARLAQEAGLQASVEVVRGRYAVEVLLSEGEQYDLLVLGSHDRSRAAGIVIGSTASKAAHETERSLMIAREAPTPAEFPGKVLLASDGSPGSWAVARAGAKIGAAFGAPLEMLHVVEEASVERQSVIEAQAAEIKSVTGEKPQLTQPSGHATQAIIEAAESKGSSLLLTGRRGLHGIKALGSVSERVVHQAPCSVLLVPAGEDAGGS